MPALDPSTVIWRKSSRTTNANCVEVAFGGSEVAVRDSKNTGPRLVVSVAGWGELLRVARGR